jgi:catechol-2,3-dioxygenase
MKFKDLTSNLMVNDVNKIVEYYKEILGFNVIQTVPETGSYVFAIINSGKIFSINQISSRRRVNFLYSCNRYSSIV